VDLNSNFYKKNLIWTGDFVKRNIDIIEDVYKKFPNRNKWSCDCHVIHDNDFDVRQIDFEFLRQEYLKIVLDFCKLKKLKLKHISDIWYNYYKIGQYQEPHIHGGNGYTVVHYMIFDEKIHSPTKFTDPTIKSPEVCQGDILFFPANLKHYVPMNSSISPRLTTAFTIVLKSEFDFDYR
jgi:hypothetical protein